MTPIEPEVDPATGRLLTEWFEFPEYDQDKLMEIACEKEGIHPDDRPRPTSFENGAYTGMSPEQAELAKRINNFIVTRKRTKFVNGMTKVEVQHRLNEATKMVNPDNYKFLPDNVRERTGLEINPLWMMECLVRSGMLSAKEQVAALKELAAYTHSKAPSIAHTTNTEMKPEDWLLELAKEEYTEIPQEVVQPKQPVERGAGPNYESRLKKKAAEVQALEDHKAVELDALEAEFEDFDLDDWEGFATDE